MSQLGVKSKTLDDHGAVSEQCVLEMAQGVRKACASAIGVAISGVAGPTGGTEEKPVGTVWVAVSDDAGEKAQKVFWQGTRQQVRKIGAFAALSVVLQRVRKDNDGK